MTFGLTVLVVLSILVLFGIGQRVLDRMRIDDKTALLFLIGMFVGTLIPDIPLGRNFSFNIGGFLIPFILVIYLFVRAERWEERRNAAVAAVLAGAGVYLAGRFLPAEPETIVFDPNYIYGIVAGAIAYLFGRSRRASFIAGVLGVIIADVAQGIINFASGIPSPLRLGGAGLVDAVVISGFLAVLLAEVTGELRERLQGGTAHKKARFGNAEFSEPLEVDRKGEEDDSKKNS